MSLKTTSMMVKTTTVLRTIIVALAVLVDIASIPVYGACPTASRKTTKEARRAAPFQAQATNQAGKTKTSNPQYMEVGRSVRGRAITAIIYGTGKKRVLMVGGIHGDERATVALARALGASFGLAPIPDDMTIIIVPEANPDGFADKARVNASGVDINRNFPARSWRPDYPDKRHYPGKQPGTEPETRALITLLERYPPDLIITFHAALGCVNWDGPAEALAQVMARENGYPLCHSLGYETPGSLGQYAGNDRNIPAVTIELQDAEDIESARLNLPALHATLTYFSTLPANTSAPKAP
jgi:protein MpaA